MLVELPFGRVALAVLCLVPAAFRWWSGRSLLALLDDPLLPERLLEYRRRNRAVLWSAIAASVALGGLADLVWTIPLTIVARSAAGYPLRRALYDERWGLGGYLAGMSRLLLAFGGFRLLLVLAPAMAAAAGRYDQVTAVTVGTLLLVWGNRSAEWIRFILRAKPLEHGAVLDRFRKIAAACTVPQPRFELVDLRGGAIANAIALPSRRGSSVLYSDTLLRLLDEDEAAAITAHEVAHLEYYSAARLLKLNLTTSALTVGAMAASLVPRLVPGLSLMTLEGVWCAVYVVVLAWIARDRQRNETASDLRAVQLCGDPEALVRGLVKIHAFARLPRRWDTRMEQAASHPSLARRVRAIRAAAGIAQSDVPPVPEALRGADGRTVITFGDALHWQESEGALHVLPYNQLTELRVDVRTARGTRLIAIERGGRRLEASLDSADAVRAQAILDRVDGRLAEPAARRAIPWLQAAGAIVAISAMVAGQLVVALVAGFAAIRSTPAFFAAAGAAALGASALVGREAIEIGIGRGAWPALVLTICGVALLAGAWRKRADEGGRVVNLGMAGLAVVALVTVSVIALRGSDAVRLYQASVALPSGAILPLALAAALAIKPRRSWRIAAVPVCLVGLMIGIAGSGTFLHAFGRDPFLVDARLLPIQTLTGSPVAEATLPGLLTDLRLSPHGKRIALTKYIGGGQYPIQFSVGVLGSTFTSIEGLDLLFLDDDRALVMAVDGTRSRLQEVRLEPRAVAWERVIDDLAGPRLSYRRGSNRWVVTGMDDQGRMASVEGTVGSGDVTRREWPTGDREEAGEVWTVDGDTALRAQRTFGFDPRMTGVVSLTMAAMLDQMETRVTRITPAGQTDVAVSRLDAICMEHALDGSSLVCTAFDGLRTHVLAFAPTGNAPQPIGSLAGRFLISHSPRGGWLSGWTMTTTGTIDLPGQVAIDLVSRRLVTLPPGLRVEEVNAAGDVAATLTHDATSTRVRMYRLDR
jgi:Zn-dependent protease with chaperone function